MGHPTYKSLVDSCGGQLFVESNWGLDFSKALEKYKENNRDESVYVCIEDEFDKHSVIGMTIPEVEKLIEYLTGLVEYFKKG